MILEEFLAGIDNCCRRIGILDFLQLIMKSDYANIKAQLKIKQFCKEITQKDIDNVLFQWVKKMKLI